MFGFTFICVLGCIALCYLFYVGFCYFSEYVILTYQASIGLMEDYLDGGRFDPEFIEEYDKFMKSKNPIVRFVVWATDMKATRNTWGE